jgi:tetratricopeptide (TPR) repeat protein
METPPASAYAVPRAARARFLGCALTLVLLGVITFGDRLAGPFIFDDEQSIVSNPSLHPFDLARALTPPRETPVAARPLLNFSFALDRKLYGLSPRGFHASNLALHLACVLIACAALSRLFSLASMPRWLRAWPLAAAFGVAVAFCVHPLATEVVLYTTQRSETLVALCYLSALWCLLHEAQTGRRSWFWVLLLGVLGAASKEVFVTAPFVLLACDRAFIARSWRGALQQRTAFHAALMASVVPLLLLQQGAPRSESVRLFEPSYLSAQARIVPGYLLHALWPARPVLDYGPLWPASQEPSWLWLALGYLSGAALLAGLALWVWRMPRSSFAALWCCAILAPTSSVISIHTEVGAERRFYLPLLGLLALLLVAAGASLERGLREASARAKLQARAAAIALGAGAILLLAAATRQHALDYGSVRAFWIAAVQARPENARAHYNLAETLRREGDPDGAILSLRRALARQETYADAHVNLSGLLIARGQLAEGLAHAERGAVLAAGSADAHYNLAVACALSGQTERALAELEATLRLQPQRWDARRRLAQGYLALGRTPEAQVHARALLSHAPGDPLALRVLSGAP